MREVGTLQFIDQDSGQEALALVRASTDMVAFALSLERDGDIEVAMRPEACMRLIQILQRGVAAARGDPGSAALGA